MTRNDKSPKEDVEVIEEFRIRFKDGPVGLWFTSLGGGYETLHGHTLRFDPDGTGKEYHRGCEPWLENGEFSFTWELTGVRRIRVLWSDRTQNEKAGREINFDFFVRYDEYENRQVFLFEPSNHRDSNWRGEYGFWEIPMPLAYHEPVEKIGLLEKVLFCMWPW